MPEPAGPLGILMLDTRFPRIVGDIGNPASFDFPVIYPRLEGIGPADAVTATPDRTRIEAALAANARSLVDAGAVGISTSCGFLALFQRELSALSAVPVATSALLLLAEARGRRAGVLTASAANLTPRHFQVVGADPGTPVEGLPPDGAFAGTFLRNGTTLDRKAVEAETVAAGRALLARCPDLDLLVLECTNLPPYKAALRAALGIEVRDVLDLLAGFHAAIIARRSPSGSAAS